MMKCWKLKVLLPIVGLLLIFNTTLVFASSLGPVQNIYAISGHEINRPSQNTIIELVWSLPEGYTQEFIEGYYYRFDTLSDEETESFNQENTAGLILDRNQTAISTDYSSVFPDDVYIYFHIAAVALDEEDEPVFGSTLTTGPFRIDTIKPKNVWVSAPSETTTPNIVLNLGAEQSNIEINISNQGYGESGSGWIPFVSTIEWLLAGEEGEKSIYVEFRDDAGNIATSSTTTVYKTSDPILAQHSCHDYLPGTNVTISNNISYTGTFSFINYLIEIPQNWQFVSTSANESNYTLLLNGNIEYSWENLESETGDNIPISCTLAVPYGESGEKSIPSLVSYQLSNNTAMNEYAQPDPLIIAKKEQYYSISEQHGKNGNVSVTNNSVAHGDAVEFQIIPDQGYMIDQLMVNSQPLSITGQSLVIDHVIQDVQLDVTFKKIEFVITVETGDNGAVQPGSHTIFYGDSVSFQITPDRGFTTGTILINNEPIEITNNKIILASVKKDYTIQVNFEKIPEMITATHQTDSFFIPGKELDIHLNINYTGFLTALGFEIQLPVGFMYKSVETLTGQVPEAQYNTTKQTLSFAWYELETGSISVVYTLTAPQDASGRFDLNGMLKYRFSNQEIESKEEKNTYSTAVIVTGEHQNLTGPYVPGQSLSIQNEITQAGNFSSFIFEVFLPDGWEYVGVSGATKPDILPDVGAQNNVEFQWSDLPDNISFIYDVKAANTDQETVSIKSLVSYTPEGCESSQIYLQPQQIHIDRAYVNATQTANKTFFNGIPFLVNNQILYNGELDNLRYQVAIPEGWNYSCVSGINVPQNNPLDENQIEFTWESIPQSPISFNYTLIPNSYTTTDNSISAVVYYQRYSDEKSILPEPQTLTFTESKFLVSHSADLCPSADVSCYTPGQQITIDNEIIYSDEYKVGDNNPNELVGLGYGVQIPEGWSYVNVQSSMEITLKEDSKDYDIEFSLVGIPDSPIHFSYTLQTPDTTDSMGNIAAKAIFRIGDENTEIIETAYPDPLVLYNNQPPSVTISSTLTSPTKSDTIPITINFSKSVMAFQAADISISNATITNFNGNGRLYTFIAIPEQEGLVTILIPQNCAEDMIGNGNMASSPFEIIVDHTQPTVLIETDTPEYANTSPWPMTITFSETVNNFEIEDISQTNATIQLVKNYGNLLFVINVYPINQGQVDVSIPGGIATDMAGNTNVQSNLIQKIYDTEPPNLTIIGNTIVRIEEGEPYEDEGAEAYDYIDGNISDQIHVDNQVDNLHAGEYKVIYDISDNAGNEQTKERIVFVDPDQLTPTVQTDAGGYLPGNDYIVSVTIRFKTGCTAMGYEIILPDGWGFDSVWGENFPDIVGFDDTNILGFAWKNVKFMETFSFSYAIKAPESASGTYPMSAEVKYRYLDQSEKKVDASFQAVEQSVVANHSSTNVYLPGHAVPVNVDIHLSSDAAKYNEFSAIGLIVNLPDNWTFDRAYGNNAPVSSVTGIVPEQGSSGIIQFAWFKIADNIISFTYDVIPPPDTTTSEIITASVKYRYANGMERSLPLLPSELVLEPSIVTVKHNCDSIYVSNSEIPVDTIITYNGFSDTLSTMRYDLSIPEGWTLTHIDGLGAPQHMEMNQNEVVLSWDDTIPSSPIIFSYALIPGTQVNTDESLTGELIYDRFNQNFTEKAMPDPITFTKGTFVARHSMLLPSAAGTYFYTPGTNITINNSMIYADSLQDSIRFIVTLPETWSFAGSSDSITHNATSANQIEFIWSQPPSSPFNFSYEVFVPSDDSGLKAITSYVEYMGGTEVATVTPDPLKAFDNNNPIPEIRSDYGATTAESSMSFTIVFTKLVTGLSRSDINMKNALFNSLTSINASTYILMITPVNQGEIQIDLPENSVTDYLGKGNVASNAINIIYDTSTPEISYIGSVEPATTNAAVIPITLILSEPVTGLTSDQLSITNGVIANFKGSGEQYTFDIIPSNQGEITIAIESGVLIDNAGNTNQMQKSLQYVYDSNAPEVSSFGFDPDSRTLNTIAPITVTIQMSEKVNNLDQTDIHIENGTISSFKASNEGSTYQAMIDPQECGFMYIYIPEKIATDKAGNLNLASETIQLTLNCTNYNGLVKDLQHQLLKDVNVSVVYPENIEIEPTKTDNDGTYSLVLPKLLTSDIYYFSLEKEGYVSENTSFSYTTEGDVGFTVELGVQVMTLISDLGYAYTITGTVSVADRTPITQVSSNPVVKVYTVHPDETQESQATVAKANGNFYIGFDNVPSLPFTVVASMKEYYAELTINSLLANVVELNMQLPDKKEQVSVNVSVDFGAEVELESETGTQVASLEIKPGSIKKSAKVDMQVVKATSTKLQQFASKSDGQLLDINLDADIIDDLIIRLKISDDITEQDLINETYFIFYAQTVNSLLSGQFRKVPSTHIIPSGEIGFVKFKVRHLTIFGVGQEIIDDLPRLKDDISNTSQRRCFISIIQPSSSHFLFLLIILTIMIGVIGINKYKSSFFLSNKFLG